MSVSLSDCLSECLSDLWNCARTDKRVGRILSQAVPGWSWSLVAVDFVVCLSCGVISFVFFVICSCFPWNAHGLQQVWGRLSSFTSVRLPGCVLGAIIYLLCLSICTCVTFVVLADCDSCTRVIITNPESMEAREYGLTRVACVVACRLELVSVVGLLCISWCGLDAAGCSRPLFFRPHTAGYKYEAALPYSPLC